MRYQAQESREMGYLSVESRTYFSRFLEVPPFVKLLWEFKK
jgi:hypothetical protein